MSYEDASGLGTGSAPTDTQATPISLFAKNSAGSEARSSQYEIAHQRSGDVPSGAIREANLQAESHWGSQAPAAPKPALEAASKRHLARATELAELLAESRQEDDPIERGILACDFRDEVKRLWEARKSRGREWSKALTLVLGVASLDQMEHWTERQASAMHWILANVLSGPYVEKEDINRIINALSNAGLRPFAGVAQPAAEEE